MALDVTVRIAFDSRWRVGTGTARPGSVDSETWVDGRGHVTVPASHLKRRLRAQAEQLAGLLGWQGLCRGRLAAALTDPEVAGGQEEAPARPRSCDEATPLPCVTCRLFGAPRVEPGWRFGSARLEPNWQPTADAERRAATHNWVDPWARRVGEDVLFTLEAARSGARLAAVVTRLDPLAEGDLTGRRELALLVGAVGLLDSLGGRARRGYGRCRAWVDGQALGQTHDQWVEELLSMPAVPR